MSAQKDNEEGLTAEQIIGGGVTIARTAEYYSPGFFQRTIISGYQYYQKVQPAIYTLAEKATPYLGKAKTLAEKAISYLGKAKTIAATAVDKGSAAAGASAPMLPIIVAAGVAFFGTEANAQKREEIKARREARKSEKVEEKLNLEHRLQGHINGKTKLENELKTTESNIDEQKGKMYAVNDIQYDSETRFIVTLGITGDGKSTLCNRLYGDISEEGDKGPFVARDSADSATQRIKCRKVNINNTEYVIVDTPGFDDSKGGDVNHANNLAEHLNAWGGVNVFVLVQNGINIRLKDSIQMMLKRFEANFGSDDFWSHLVIVLTSIESKPLVKKFNNKKQLLIKKINAVFPESKKHDIPIKPIGLYKKSQFSSFLSTISIFADASHDSCEDGYDYYAWRLQLIGFVSDDKVLCNRMVPPLKLLKKKRERLNQKIAVLNIKITQKRNQIGNLQHDIATIQNAIDNAASFVLFD
eukprot:318183_1